MWLTTLTYCTAGQSFPCFNSSAWWRYFLQHCRCLSCKASLVLYRTHTDGSSTHILFDNRCKCSVSAKNKAFQLMWESTSPWVHKSAEYIRPVILLLHSLQIGTIQLMFVVSPNDCCCLNMILIKTTSSHYSNYNYSGILASDHFSIVDTYCMITNTSTMLLLWQTPFALLIVHKHLDILYLLAVSLASAMCAPPAGSPTTSTNLTKPLHIVVSLKPLCQHWTQASVRLSIVPSLYAI